MIVPTVGRVVWYRPAAAQFEGASFANYGGQPCSAQVAFVWNDSCVNLVVTDHAGNQHARTSVQLVQEGDTQPTGQAYCEWMPYQRGQAARTEQLERAAAETTRLR